MDQNPETLEKEQHLGAGEGMPSEVIEQYENLAAEVPFRGDLAAQEALEEDDLPEETSGIRTQLDEMIAHRDENISAKTIVDDYVSDFPDSIRETESVRLLESYGADMCSVAEQFEAKTLDEDIIDAFVGDAASRPDLYGDDGKPSDEAQDRISALAETDIVVDDATPFIELLQRGFPPSICKEFALSDTAAIYLIDARKDMYDAGYTVSDLIETVDAPSELVDRADELIADGAEEEDILRRWVELETGNDPVVDIEEFLNKGFSKAALQSSGVAEALTGDPRYFEHEGREDDEDDDDGLDVPPPIPPEVEDIHGGHDAYDPDHGYYNDGWD